MRKYQVVAIAQIYNEIRKENLERFFAHLKPLVDDIVVYDDASTDGSYEYALTQTPHVIRARHNAFSNEISHKQALLTKALTLKPDFILWLDADEVLSANTSSDLQSVCKKMEAEQIDGMSFHELNLWRNRSWKRIDNAYDDGWFMRLWRVTPGIGYRGIRSGLHQVLYPTSLKTLQKSDVIKVIHYGFATPASIASKYLTYREHGQTGWALERLIDESTLALEKVSPEEFPADLRTDDPKPTPWTSVQWHDVLKAEDANVFRPGISIVCLIYKSTTWLQYVYEQVLRYTDLRTNEFFFVANDATDNVVQYLQSHLIPHVVFNNTEKDRKEWYINNVYRAWNFAAEQAKGDYILFINSDMGFSPNWVETLFEKTTGKNSVAARLVESGKMQSGQFGISKNFGLTVEEYDERGFLAYAKKVSEPVLRDGGLFMPLLIKKEHFQNVGGYPEGNVVPGSDPWQPTIAKQGEPVVSGDVIFIEKLRQRGIVHQTSFDSLIYHFQEGEMDDIKTGGKEQSDASVIVVNDVLTGTMGERTFWDEILEKLPGVAGVDSRVVGTGPRLTDRIRSHINKEFPYTAVILQNASFLERVDLHHYTIAFLQDDLRRMGKPSPHQEKTLRHVQRRVTNSYLTAASYPEYNFDVIPVGVNHKLFQPRDKTAVRKELNLPEGPIGIFVGDFTPVKGWPKISKIIEQRKDITWLVVTKTPGPTPAGQHVRIFVQIPQETLAKLYSAADFFLIGSPVETQCLSAIEAGLCNTPILMHLTGIFSEFSQSERDKIGIFCEDLAAGVNLILKQKFEPRTTLLTKPLTVDAMVASWHELLVESVQEARTDIVRQASIPWQTALVMNVRRSIQHNIASTIKFIKLLIHRTLPKPFVERLAAWVKKIDPRLVD